MSALVVLPPAGCARRWSVTDPRDLIQRLADALAAHHQLPGRVPLITEARAYLAQPEPAAGPTRRQIMMLADDLELGDLDGGTRLVLEAFRRWGHQPQPIPLSERLPGPEDCDAEGRCWVFDQGDAVTEPAWNLTSAADLQDVRQMEADGTLIGLCERWRLAWLPHHALPLPEAHGKS